MFPVLNCLGKWEIGDKKSQKLEMRGKVKGDKKNVSRGV